jgi:hypothetical protein
MALEVPDALELEGSSFVHGGSRTVEIVSTARRLFQSPEMRAGFFGRPRSLPGSVGFHAPLDTGSLDDTGVAQFRFIRQNRATSARRGLPKRAPGALPWLQRSLDRVRHIIQR